MRSGQDAGEVREVTGTELLRLPVRLRGIDLGRAVDVLLDREGLRVVGLDVLCGDEDHRFLPLPTAAVDRDALTILSPLVLLEEDELDFYRSRAFALSSLRRRPVLRAGFEVGRLVDVVIAPNGVLVAVEVDSGGRIPFDETLQFAPQRRSAA
jgi:hypothetical protein